MIKVVYYASILSFFGVFIFGIGVFIGVYVGHSSQSSDAVDIHTPEEKTPTITIEKIENGEMYIQSNRSDIRILLENDIIISPNQENFFQFSIVSLLPMLKTLPSPAGSVFVASKRGKTYWPLDAPNAFLISPKNRVFYFSKEEAIADEKRKGE